MFENLSFDEIEKLIEKGGQLIDVRSSMEFLQGALCGAVNIPLDSIQSSTESIDKNKPVILYCRSGMRSGIAKQFLETLGFDEVYNIGSYQNYATR
jgi:phage shock protein E